MQVGKTECSLPQEVIDGPFFKNKNIAHSWVMDPWFIMRTKANTVGWMAWIFGLSVGVTTTPFSLPFWCPWVVSLGPIAHAVQGLQRRSREEGEGSESTLTCKRYILMLAIYINMYVYVCVGAYTYINIYAISVYQSSNQLFLWQYSLKKTHQNL